MGGRSLARHTNRKNTQMGRGNARTNQTAQGLRNRRIGPRQLGRRVEPSTAQRKTARSDENLAATRYRPMPGGEGQATTVRGRNQSTIFDPWMG
jgi:hypothetical protein